MTSLEYAENNNKAHWFIMRKINEYMRYLKASTIDASEYFIEKYYKHENGVAYRMYEIKEKGLKVLENNVHCNKLIDYCEAAFENKTLPLWIYRNLNNYGNCAISLKILEEYGQEEILNNLKENGLDCDIRIEHKTIVEKYLMDSKSFNMDYCILTVKRK